MASIYITIRRLSSVGRTTGRRTRPGLQLQHEVAKRSGNSDPLRIHHGPGPGLDLTRDLPRPGALQGDASALPAKALHSLGRKPPQRERSGWGQRLRAGWSDHAV